MDKQQQQQEINAEIREILGSIPGWGLRWGITAVFVAIMLLLLLAAWIRYPDTISAPVVILTENPPVRLLAQRGGQLDQLKVEEEAVVSAGDILAVFENTAHLDDILKLDGWLNQQEQRGSLDLEHIPQNLNLGSLQPIYAQLQQLAKDYRYFDTQQDVVQKIAAMRNQMNYLDSLNQTLDLQAVTLQREVDLAKANLKRNQSLYKTGAISLKDLENIETFYLQYQRQLDAIKAGQLRNKIEQEKLRKEIISLRQGRNDSDIEKLLNVQRSIQEVQSGLAQWKQDFLVVAPIDGRVAFNQPITEGQYFGEEQQMMVILPQDQQGTTIARGSLPTVRSGKVRKGMTTNIFLDAYPYQEYGILKGKLMHVAPLAEQSTYLIEIDLPDSLVTTYGEVIPLVQEQPGRADIITEDRSLLERLLDGILSLLKNN
jgi:multidrug resistance efflux pump